ncbi:DsbA family oxidoreductase [Arcanobacterium hippocoleae]|uniref:DsbA family dithiol-disulfide isomerase n=1 Tax=Arcanobacterium hippocoleae TaxID=149017 RepID=A0ABU1T3T7_9ACTO|nr:DsbA family oxidoreductase [Arcanobacterium hippocoleae]MDR6939526.1 putative DsbA family dithiol-disulfide isomerase [Arcanobacterium hippocoleae]
MEHEIVVHAWADVACPWCWLGKRRLEKGIALSGAKVAVEYHSYQLRADAPASTNETLAKHLANSHAIPLTEVSASFAKITELGAEYGISYDWNAVQPVNTFLAHQLIYAAKATGQNSEEAAVKGGEMFERLWKAYFSEGANIADSDTLIDIAEELGMDREHTEAELESGEHADSVRADIRDAARINITGVPFYVIGGKLGVSGCQTAEIFADGIKQALTQMRAEPQL